MFLFSVKSEIFNGIQGGKLDYILLPYDNSMTHSLFANFESVWGKAQAVKAMKHLSDGLLIGLKQGFDVVFSNTTNHQRINSKIYWLHSFTKFSPYGYVSGYGVKVFLCKDADKRYSSELDKTQKWGEIFMEDA